MKKSYEKIFLGITAITLLLIFTFFGALSMLKSLYPTYYAETVETYAKENNLDIYFVYAVIKCESNFDKNAVSHLGARGLMQIMPDTFAWLSDKKGEKNDAELLFDPEVNIEYGCYFYGILMEEYADEATALAAYHAGMGNVSRWLLDERYSSDGKTLSGIPFENTRNYVNKVLKTKNIYLKLYNGKEE